MPDWQIIIEDETTGRGRKPLPAPAPQRSRWRWLLLAGSVLLLAVVGVITLQAQRERGQAAIRQDLTAFLFEEETLRAGGRRSEAGHLLAPTAPARWRRDYWATFAPPAEPVRPRALELGPIAFDGRCATVDVEADGQPQVRHYCLGEAGWQRAPLPSTAWGSTPTAINFSNGVTLQFYERDQPFAEALVPDLRRLFELLAEAPDGDEALTGLLLRIEPADLESPLLRQAAGEIVVNSPLLAQPVPPRDLSAAAEVRLALAQAILAQAEPAPPAEPQVPGYLRFRLALREVTAIQLMLPPEAQRQLRDEWKSGRDGPWRSPFQIYPPREPPFPSETLRLTALLTADYIQQRWGLKMLLDLDRLLRIDQTGGWDELFLSTLQRPTIALDNEAEFYTAHGLRLLSTTWRAEDTMPPPLPLTVSLQQRLVAPAGWQRLLGQPLAGSDLTPLVVDFPDTLEVSTLDNGSLSLPCLPPGSQLEIRGEWLEMRRRLKADKLTLVKVQLAKVAPVEAIPLAYLGEPFTEQNSTESSRVYPGTASYLQARHPQVSQALLALRPDGTVQRLIRLSPSLAVTPLPTPAGERPHFLFEWHLPDCQRSWLIHIEPVQGQLNFWHSPPQPVRWMWRSDQAAPVFATRRDDGPGYDIYRALSPFTGSTLGHANAAMGFIGWHLEQSRLVATNASQGETFVGLLDWDSGYVEQLAPPYDQTLRSPSLSPDGAWLAHLGRINNFHGPSNRVDVLEVATGRERPWLQLAERERIAGSTWSNDPSRPRLAILAEPVDEADFNPTRLLLVQPDRPGEALLAGEAGPGERWSTPVFCGDGSLLVRVEREGQYDLRRVGPGVAAETLFTSAKSFWPLACP